MDRSPSSWSRLAGVCRSRRAGVALLAVVPLAVLYAVLAGKFDFFGLGNRSEAELGGGGFSHYTPFTTSFLSSIWPLALTALLLTLAAVRLAWTMARARNLGARSLDHEAGASAVEFVMIMPVLTVLLLMILQIALLVQAKFVVNYAAFCAARSAIVVIPDDANSAEPRNRLAGPQTSEKIAVIHRAAALPLTAISPLPGLSAARGNPIWTNPEASLELLKLAPFDVGPRSMVVQTTLRAPYAYDDENTEVKVLTRQGVEGGSFQNHDWVTVKVKYRYFLTVPFAKKLFGTSFSGNPLLDLFLGTEYYYPIVEQYTLPMDGEPSGISN